MRTFAEELLSPEDDVIAKNNPPTSENRSQKAKSRTAEKHSTKKKCRQKANLRKEGKTAWINEQNMKAQASTKIKESNTEEIKQTEENESKIQAKKIYM